MPTPTYTDTILSNLVISKISQAKFNELKTAGLLNEDELYLVENETLDAMGNVVKNVGTPVQNTDAANKAYVDGKTPPVATSSTAGIVKPDGTTITVDANGVISSSGGGGGGGTVGYTVTIDSNFAITHFNNSSALASAPIICTKVDGTTQTIDLATNPAGTTITDVIEIHSGTWTTNSSSSVFQGANTTTGLNLYNYITFSNGYRLYAKVDSDAINISPFYELRLMDSLISRVILTEDVTIIGMLTNISCLLKGTLIRLANGNDKPVEEITYDDDLLVWDFDNGKFSSAKPIWIKKAQKANYYFRNILASGKELLTTGQSGTGWGHRMFDVDKGKFRYTTETVSDRIFTLDGIDFHKSCERIEAECEHYNIITEKHFNLFANGILTSCSYNNLYPVTDMKFIKDNRRNRPFEVYDVPIEYYNGMRLSEQTIDPNEVNEYIKNLINLAVERNNN